MLRTKALRGSQKAWRFPAQVSQKASEAPKLSGELSRAPRDTRKNPRARRRLPRNLHGSRMGMLRKHYVTMAAQWKWHRRCPGVFPECYGRGTGAVHERYREAGEWTALCRTCYVNATDPLRVSGVRRVCYKAKLECCGKITGIIWQWCGTAIPDR